ncbi:MAG: HAMP domain-containing histidine kinase [Myxococcales bacterium]|nr:HAMP domain-containing histidine kinase [Myxococcales bacterium]MCB9553567.1 HAMP domain-containing histidine kinase [Myxococcales bacterium]
MIGRPRRLMWRIYLHGLLVLVGFAACVAVLGLVLRDGDRGPLAELPARVSALMPAIEGGGTQDATARLGAFAELLHLDLALYARDGTVVAVAGERPPGPLRAGEAAPTGEAVAVSRGWRRQLAVPVDGGARYLMVAWRHGWGGRFVMAVGGVLLFLAMLSIPLARAVVRPLERLTATARALGAGDLAARSGLDRRDEIGELARALDEMAARLQALLARERELLANVSHELRTPLARIRVALELAADEGERPPSLVGVEDDLAELEGLVADVLTSARLAASEGGAAGFSLDLGPLDAAAVVAAAAARLGERHPGRAVAVAVGAGLPAVRADGALVRRVLDNLLENAARYGEGPIEVAVAGEGGGVRFSVSDRGPGIDAVDLPHLFEPFFRGERSRSRRGGGVGLGLTLCRRIVEAHGGRIEAATRPEGGARFSFVLPGERGA